MVLLKEVANLVLTDVSDKLGQPDTFMLNLQPLLKRNDFVKGATSHNEGGKYTKRVAEINLLLNKYRSSIFMEAFFL
jgi:hypothetical protein